MVKSKLVSVIITTYGKPDTLLRAVYSVLLQTYEHYEIIVVDDNGLGSQFQRETQKLLANLVQERILRYYVHSVHRNGSVARNTGLKHARGAYVAYLDNDDVYLPRRLEKCVEILEHAPDTDGILTGVILCSHKRPLRVLSSFLGTDIRTSVLVGGNIGTGSNLFFRTDSLRSIGGFDGRFVRNQDIQAVIHFLRHFRMVEIPDLLVAKDTGSTNNAPDVETYRAVRKLFHSCFQREINALSPADRQKLAEGEARTLASLGGRLPNQSVLAKAEAAARRSPQVKGAYYAYRSAVTQSTLLFALGSKGAKTLRTLLELE